MVSVGLEGSGYVGQPSGAVMSGSCEWVPAFPGQRPPFQPGHELQGSELLPVPEGVFGFEDLWSDADEWAYQRDMAAEGFGWVGY